MIKGRNLGKDKVEVPVDLEKRRYKRLKYSSIFVIIIVWEVFAHILKLITPHAVLLWPTFEDIFLISLPYLAVFYGMGGLATGTYGQGPSYPFALIVIGYHTYVTFIRIIAGFLIGGFLGIGLGLLVKANKKICAFIELPFLFIRIVPLMALIPLFIVWFGSREIGFMIYIGFAVSVVLYINTINAVDNVRPIYQKFALTLGATRGQLFRTVIVPAVIPELLGGFKMIVGQAWALSLASEFLNAQNGLGRLIVLARLRLNTGVIIIVLLLYLVYSLSFLKVLTSIGNYVTRWMPRMER